jgi:hypothetical protein
LLYTQFWAPDDGRKDRPKHVERFTRINNLRDNRFISLIVLYEHITMHGHMNIKFIACFTKLSIYKCRLIYCKILEWIGKGKEGIVREETIEKYVRVELVFEQTRKPWT